MRIKYLFILICLIVAQPQCWATIKMDLLTDSTQTYGRNDDSLLNISSTNINVASLEIHGRSIYSLPYSVNTSMPNWKRLWTNTAVLSGAFVGTLLVLECLPEDATSWNRREIQEVPVFKRWFRNVFKRGPEWDHDKFYFNYILHPYAGAAYYMGARSCGFNAWQSLLYCTCISTIEWEFGIEAFMERPSIQDLFITPLVGSAMGEGFYAIKRYIAQHDYSLWGSKIAGNVVAFLADPINEFIGIFAGNDARHINEKKTSAEISISPVFTPKYRGLAFSATF